MSENTKTLIEKIHKIQQNSEISKGRKAKNYKYYNFDDLQEIINPLLIYNNIVPLFSEDIFIQDGRAFIKCAFKLHDLETNEIYETISVSEIPLNPGIMSSQQATKASISFARKQCYENTFAITEPESMDGDDLLPKGEIPLDTSKQGYIESRKKDDYF